MAEFHVKISYVISIQDNDQDQYFYQDIPSKQLPT